MEFSLAEYLDSKPRDHKQIILWLGDMKERSRDPLASLRIGAAIWSDQKPDEVIAEVLSVCNANANIAQCAWFSNLHYQAELKARTDSE